MNSITSPNSFYFSKISIHQKAQVDQEADEVIAEPANVDRSLFQASIGPLNRSKEQLDDQDEEESSRSSIQSTPSNWSSVMSDDEEELSPELKKISETWKKSSIGNIQNFFHARTDERQEVLEVLGQGTGKTVYFAQGETSNCVICTGSDIESIRLESEALFLCTEREIPWTPKVLDPFFRGGKYLACFTQEFGDLGPLDSWGEKKGYEEKVLAFLKLSETLKALHKEEFAHGDIKPGNIVMKSNLEGGEDPMLID